MRPWRDVAAEALAAGAAAHLSVVDADGYPVPMRVTDLALVEDGFRLTMPRGVPWTYRGRASLTFAGFRTFVGEAATEAGTVHMRIERSLPQHPSTFDTRQVLQPSEDTKAKARARLEHEAARRGQPLPAIPDEPAPRTRLAKLRMARIAGDAPITGITVAHGNRRS